MSALEEFRAAKHKFCVRTDGGSFCNGICVREIDKCLRPEDVSRILNHLYYYAADRDKDIIDTYIEECTDKYDYLPYEEEEILNKQHWTPGREGQEHD